MNDGGGRFAEDCARYLECMGGGDARQRVVSGGMSERDWWIVLKRHQQLTDLLHARGEIQEDDYTQLAHRAAAAAGSMTVPSPAVLRRGACVLREDLHRYVPGTSVTLERFTFVSPDEEYARFFTFPKNAAGDIFPRPSGYVGVLFEFHRSDPSKQRRGALVPASLTNWPVPRVEIMMPIGAVYVVSNGARLGADGLWRVTLDAQEAATGLPELASPSLKAAPLRVLTEMWRDLQREARDRARGGGKSDVPRVRTSSDWAACANDMIRRASQAGGG